MQFDVTPDLLRRFWAKVDKNGPVVRADLGPCWMWTGYRDAAEYGTVRIGGRKGRTLKAHRVSFFIARGCLEDTADVCHACDTPSCVRPSHLFAGNNAANMADMVAKGRSARGERSGRRMKPERTARGSRASKAKLTEAAVLTIRQRYAAGEATQAELSREYGISDVSIHRIVRRHSWVHI